MFQYEDFFSTQEFAHSLLWQKEGFLWDPLIHLEIYLKTVSHKIEIEIPDGVYLKNLGEISIGEGTIIDPSVLIEGPCIIGRNCTIRHGAFLRAGTVLGEECMVGHASEIKNSLLMDGAVASHFCYVGDSILGPNVNLGAGVKCANLRLDRKKIFGYYQGKKIQTHLEKLGAILGEGVQVGCNCVLNPGTFIGKKSIVYPLVNIGGFTPPMKRVRT